MLVIPGKWTPLRIRWCRSAILAKADGLSYQVEDITRDHKPNLPGEKARILASGGRVFALDYDDGYVGPERVWLQDHDIPGLAMSRSLGDTVAHSVGRIVSNYLW